MTTQAEETEVTSAQLTTFCTFIQVVTTDPLVYALDVSFGSDIPVWQQTSSPIANYLMNTYTRSMNDTMSNSTAEFIKEMQAQYQYNQTQKEQLEAQRRVIMSAHEGFRTISERFAAEADNRGWCDDANDFIISVNEEISSPFSLEELYHDYDATVFITPEVTVTLTTSIRARSQEAAEDLLRDDVSSYFDESDIRDAMRDADIDGYDVVDIEVTES